MPTPTLFIPPQALPPLSRPVPSLGLRPLRAPCTRAHTRRPRSAVPWCATPAPRATDARGFVVPEAGDVVLYSGRWADEDAAGLVQSVRYNEARASHTVDVAELRRVGRDLFAVPASARRAARWFDSAELRVVSAARYVPEQDAYLVEGTRDGYAVVPPLDDEARELADAEYRKLKASMLRATVATAAAGTAATALLLGPQVGVAFAYGGAASAAYLAMLQANVDAMGASSLAARLLVLRFALPVVPFLLLAAPALQGAHGMDALLGSVSKPQTLAAVLGLLCYKVPLLTRTGGEFVDGLADIEMGKTGMVGTVASLAARQIRKRRDGTEGDDAAPAAPQQVFVFAGPSGAGKSTLIRRLMDEYPDRFDFSVSHTTRAPREGEKDGVDYNFVDTGTFEAMVARGEFVEHARVHGQCYGSSYAAVNAVLADGRLCILDLDVQGVEALREKGGLQWEPRFVWIAPPSMAALEERLRARGTETDESVKRRLDTAKRELMYAATNNVFDLTVINSDVDEAYDELRRYINRETEGGGGASSA